MTSCSLGGFVANCTPISHPVCLPACHLRHHRVCSSQCAKPKEADAAAFDTSPIARPSDISTPKLQRIELSPSGRPLSSASSYLATEAPAGQVRASSYSLRPMTSGQLMHHYPPPPPRTPSPSPPSIIEPPSATDDQYQRGRDTDRAFHHSPGHAHGFLSPNTRPRLASPSSSLLLPPGMAMADDDDDTRRAQPAEGVTAGGSPARNPFNFQTQMISTSPVRNNVGQRRGHRYKHSSISTQHQIFQEPPQRPPPVLPASLPIPTLFEAWGSIKRDQWVRILWSLCHGAVAGYTFFSAEGSLAMTALSHLIFFDAGSAAICVCVDVLANFDVWHRSSVRHPFGLQRAEVLAGFAMSIFLVFGGFDLLSHNFKHVMESVGSHEPHHDHGSGHGHGHGHAARVSPGTVDTASLAAIVATLVSAVGLKNHSRIRRIMRVQYPSYLTSLPSVLLNPFHFLTLSFSFTLLILPLLSIGTSAWLDTLICVAIAVSMFVLGSRLAVAQGMILLMSFGGAGGASAASGRRVAESKESGVAAANDAVSAVVREIEAEPNVARVEEAKFWQVHYGLCMANLKVCTVRGCDDLSHSQLRGRVARLIQNRLGEGYGRGGSLRWEVTMQLSTDSRS